ncbi:MAG: nucleotide sugar dehydrogenase [Bacillota bacterium]
MNICVVGLGNIGLNLYTHLLSIFPNSVTGIDINRSRVSELKKLGYRVAWDYTAVNGVDVWLLVPSTGPNGENIVLALEQMEISPGSLISIESTLPPDTMYRVRCHLKDRGFELGRSLYLIHVPHRVMFGYDKTVCDTPRVMGAFTRECLAKGREFYQPLVPQIVETLDVRVAELSKIVENAKRYVDIAFAQEIYRYCAAAGLSFEELRQAVNSKENVDLLAVDWGIGGECLPKDIGFLRKVVASPLLDGAVEADTSFQYQVLKQTGTGKKILVRGVSYKPGVKNLEHSIGVKLVKALVLSGNDVFVEDPLFSPEELTEAGLRPFRTDGRSVQPDVVLNRNAPLAGQQKF